MGGVGGVLEYGRYGLFGWGKRILVMAMGGMVKDKDAREAKDGAR